MSPMKDAVARAKLRLERARARYGWLDVGVSTFKRFSDDDGGFHAAALTYYTFFSIFPLILFASAALGYAVFLDEDLRARIFNAGVEAFPLLKQVLKAQLGTIQDRRLSLAIVAILLTLYSGTGGVVAFQHALNKINGVTDEGTFVSKRLAALKYLASLGGVAILSVAFGVLALVPGIGGLLGFLGGLAASVALFVSAFRYLPRGNEVALKDVLPGAVAAALAFEVLKRVGAVYLRAGNQGRTATFGAFATAAGLLVASYLLCQIALLAAELNAVLSERRRSREFSLADKA